MLKLDSLDTLIAIVVVLLVLSLIVQSVQGAIKKFFRIKSLQLEQSLVHLFYYGLDKDTLTIMRTMTDRVPLLRAVFSLPGLRGLVKKEGGSLVAGDAGVQALYDGVARELLRAGRITAAGKLQTDGLSKEELLKFLGRVRIGSLLPHLSSLPAGELTALQSQVAAARDQLEALFKEHGDVLEGTPLADAELPLLHLLNNAAQFLAAGEDDFTLEELAHFGAAEIAEARRLLLLTPDSVQKTLRLLNERGHDDARKAVLSLGDAIAPLREEFDKIVALPAKLSRVRGQIEDWYDTIMLSFAERYARSMKSWSIFISFLVVFLLNANIFTIYRTFSANDDLRAQAVQTGEQLRNAAPGTAPQDAKTQIKQNVDQYTALGFEGPQWLRQIKSRVQTATFASASETLLGWIIMALLLSVGAPFWEDTLGSLFGLKNLLRNQGKGKDADQ